MKRVNELQELIRSGRLPAGSILEHKGRRENAPRVEAKVEHDGVHVEGRVYPSLSTAARAVAGHAINGWVYWRLVESGKRLADLRQTS
jgi:hypothetical protein